MDKGIDTCNFSNVPIICLASGKSGYQRAGCVSITPNRVLRNTRFQRWHCVRIDAAIAVDACW